MEHKPEKTETKLHAREYAEQQFREFLHVKIGQESNLEDVLSALNRTNGLTIVISANYNIFISDRNHNEILEKNDLQIDFTSSIEGSFDFREGPLRLTLYRGRGQADTVFASLYEKSGLSDSEFRNVFHNIVREKILAFLNK